MDKIQKASNPEKIFSSDFFSGSVFSFFVQGDLERKRWEVKKIGNGKFYGCAECI
jgi:hypothetical protein